MSVSPFFEQSQRELTVVGKWKVPPKDIIGRSFESRTLSLLMQSRIS
jgi:hypothetical protein